MVNITHIRLSTNGSTHEHITAVQWRNPSSEKTGSSTKAEMVSWIRDKSGDARVRRLSRGL